MDNFLEEKMLEVILSRQPIDFMNFRNKFWGYKNYDAAFNNLIKLKLIKEVSDKIDTNISLTGKGYDAIEMGLGKWVTDKVEKDLEAGTFKFAGGITTLEVKAFKNRQNRGGVVQRKLAFPSHGFYPPITIGYKLKKIFTLEFIIKHLMQFVLAILAMIGGTLLLHHWGVI